MNKDENQRRILKEIPNDNGKSRILTNIYGE